MLIYVKKESVRVTKVIWLQTVGTYKEWGWNIITPLKTNVTILSGHIFFNNICTFSKN